ncbi:hypothetical protein TNIN_225011 [Trichonephila inaurata madagascariensis]|uniref:Uncharacterized protein n=1 Tax=Trichonephila inaurata madagascariensis TaxID=2747483 RepID=A0A8X6WRW9_9ARAC|nr:hypothetical protein TNIN_225011 [Trichonephila inaurata madagascariensis]
MGFLTARCKFTGAIPLLHAAGALPAFVFRPGRFAPHRRPGVPEFLKRTIIDTLPCSAGYFASLFGRTFHFNVISLGFLEISIILPSRRLFAGVSTTLRELCLLRFPARAQFAPHRRPGVPGSSLGTISTPCLAWGAIDIRQRRRTRTPQPHAVNSPRPPEQLDYKTTTGPGRQEA